MEHDWPEITLLSKIQVVAFYPDFVLFPEPTQITTLYGKQVESDQNS